jgi:hypothetical protein
MSGIEEPKSPDSTQLPPGSGYIPPDSALTFNALSAGTSGPALGVALMTLGWSLSAPAGDYARVAPEVGAIHNVPLAAGLLSAAIVFAALALLVTAVTDRYSEYQRQYKVLTPKWVLWSYVSLTTTGLAADVLALDFLSRRAFNSFHLATLLGTLLELGALFLGAYSLVPRWKWKLAKSARNSQAAQTSRASN